MIREKVRKVSSGYLMLIVLLVAQLATGYWIYRAVLVMSIPQLVAAVLVSVVVLIMWAGLFMIHPNEAKVLQLFGSYAGTAHEPGLEFRERQAQGKRLQR
jgi:regulator of protease activity HflC (stomatin/prohibitin superfamily)